MTRHVAWLLLALWSAVVTGPAGAQSRILPPSRTRPQEIGLQRAWTTAVMTSRDGRIADVTVYASPRQTFTAFEVSDGRGQSLSFTERDPDQRGLPLGVDEARRRAENLLAEWRARGRDAELATVDVAHIHLYVQTTDGIVQALDGESGRTLWSVQVGRSYYPVQPPAVNDTIVAAINGSTLYVLVRDTGLLLQQKALDGMPVAGAAIFGDLIYVPTTGGKIEVYRWDDISRSAYMYQSPGRANAAPLASPLSINWVTDDGTTCLADPGVVGVRARVITGERTMAGTARLEPGVIFSASWPGYVQAIQEQDGNLLWRYVAGDAISQTPVAVDDALYVVTDGGQLHALNATSGEPGWVTTGVLQVVAVGEQRLYAAALGPKLLVLDRETGGRVAAMSWTENDLFVTNTATDRLYYGSRRGRLECLRESERRWPLARPRAEEMPPEQGESAAVEGDQAAPEPGPPSQPATTPDQPMPAADGDPFQLDQPAEEPAEAPDDVDPFDLDSEPAADAAEDIFGF
jgi:outer membrane protein assembly factor BamB